MTLPNNNNYFASLTGVRAIAAYIVFIHHFNPFKEGIFGRSVYLFANEFHIGVTLFFVLSGFLIAYRYSELHRFNFKDYIANRIARIYPMYFIITTGTFLLYIISDIESITKSIAIISRDSALYVYLSNVTLIRGYFEKLKFTGVPQGWSLTVEETFYLLAPLFFVLIKKNKVNLIALPLVLVAFGTFMVSTFKDMPFYGFFESYEFMFIYTFFGRAFEFFIGIGLAIAYKKNLFNANTKFLTYTGIFIIFLCIYGLTFVKGDADLGVRQPSGKFINTFILPIFGISIFYLGLLREETIVSRVLKSKLLALLGKSSYIFYLIHLGVISNIIYEFIPNYFVVFLLLNVISVLLFKYIEEPANRYIRKRFTSKLHLINEPKLEKANHA